MFSWFYDLPSPIGFLVITSFCVGFTSAGTWLVRPWIRRFFGPEPGRNDMITMVLTVGGVFYGLLIGLVAVAGYEGYASAQDRVSAEAAALGTLYREVSAYPEPQRAVLRQDLTDYTRNVLSDAFPALRRGDEPQGGTALVTRFQEHLLSFQPSTEAESIVHAATIDEFATFDQARRHRINATAGGIPGVLWWTIAIGAIINLALVCMFSFDARAAHLLVGGMLAFFLGTMVFLIAALDYPFRGDLSVGPQPFESMYVNVMGGELNSLPQAR